MSTVHVSRNEYQDRLSQKHTKFSILKYLLVEVFRNKTKDRMHRKRPGNRFSTVLLVTRQFLVNVKIKRAAKLVTICLFLPTWSFLAFSIMTNCRHLRRLRIKLVYANSSCCKTDYVKTEKPVRVLRVHTGRQWISVNDLGHISLCRLG